MLLIRFKFAVFLKHVLIMLHYAGPNFLNLKVATYFKEKLFNFEVM